MSRDTFNEQASELLATIADALLSTTEPPDWALLQRLRTALIPEPPKVISEKALESIYSTTTNQLFSTSFFNTGAEKPESYKPYYHPGGGVL